MALVSMKEMLIKAKAEGYAVVNSTLITLNGLKQFYKQLKKKNLQ